MTKRRRAKRVLRYLGRVGLGIVSLSLLSSPAGAAEEAKKAVGGLSTLTKVHYTLLAVYLGGTSIPAPGAPLDLFRCFMTGIALHGATLK